MYLDTKVAWYMLHAVCINVKRGFRKKEWVMSKFNDNQINQSKTHIIVIKYICFSFFWHTKGRDILEIPIHHIFCCFQPLIVSHILLFLTNVLPYILLFLTPILPYVLLFFNLIKKIFVTLQQCFRYLVGGYKEFALIRLDVFEFIYTIFLGVLVTSFILNFIVFNHPFYPLFCCFQPTF